MNIFIIILFFVYGIIFGSFFNVVGLRVPVRASIVHPPSHCPNCQHRLTVRDLVPVFSYIALRGACRKCQQRISPLYPVMELLTGSLFVFAYVTFGFQPELVVAIMFFSLFVIITVSDITYMLIPDRVLLFFAVIFVGLRIWTPLTPWWDSLVGAVVGFSLLLLIAVISKGGMGGGDIKLFFVIGLVLGTTNTLLTLFIAALLGAIVGLFVVKKKKSSTKTPIPFGPFIALGAIIVYVWGNQIVEWYIQMLN